MDEERPEPQPEPEPYTGPRTLDGRPAPASIPTVDSSSGSAPPKKKGGFATLDSLSKGAGGHAGHGQAHDDDDDDSSDDDYEPGEEPRDLFAGGEKSGLAVQDPSNRNDPRKVVDDILKKARAYVPIQYFVLNFAKNIQKCSTTRRRGTFVICTTISIPWQWHDPRRR